MKTSIKTQPCPECDGEMRHEKHEDVLTYKGHTRTIKTLGWWCTACDEAILSGEPLQAHERAFQKFKAEVDGVLGPEEVTRVRERLGLSQRKASELLGGVPEVRVGDAGCERAHEPPAHLAGQRPVAIERAARRGLCTDTSPSRPQDCLILATHRATGNAPGGFRTIAGRDGASGVQGRGRLTVASSDSTAQALKSVSWYDHSCVQRTIQGERFSITTAHQGDLSWAA